MKITKRLRELGIDVIDVGNFNYEVEKSFIIDRSGNQQYSKEFAQLVEVNPSDIITQVSQDYLFKITLVLGKDYQRFISQNISNTQ